MNKTREAILAARNTYCKQINDIETVYDAFGHDLFNKEPAIFFQVEANKSFVQCLEWILKLYDEQS